MLNTSLSSHAIIPIKIFISRNTVLKHAVLSTAPGEHTNTHTNTSPPKRGSKVGKTAPAGNASMWQKSQTEGKGLI